MAEEDDTRQDMKRTGRFVYGPRPVGALVPSIARVAFRRTPAAVAQIMLDWPQIVGPGLAAVTEPRRLASGTLTLACAGPMAMQLQHMAIEVMNRINGHVGTPIVRALRFVQVHKLAPDVKPAPARIPPAAVTATEKKLADFPAGELRDALARLGQQVHTPRPPTPPHSTRRGRAG